FPIPPGQSIEPEVLGRGREALAATLLDSAVAAYQAKEEQIGTEVMRQVERYVMLRTIDGKWVDYLTQMEQFREGIGLRAYGQRDPLVEYKNEAFEMFNELTDRIQGSIVATIFRVSPAPAAAPAPAPAPARQLVESGPAEPDGSNGAGRKTAQQQRRAAPVGAAAVSAGGTAEAGAANHKIGRNDPCWCGSGKK